VQAEERPESTLSEQPQDLVEQLRRLSELYEEGALTDEEFSAAKSKLLDD